MSSRDPQIPQTEDEPRSGESFFSRFHRLKTEARQVEETDVADAEPTQEATALTSEDAADEEVRVDEPPTDADMPPLETLEFSSDFSGFLSPKVSDGLRRAALRKLFHSAELNIVDGLDEYAEDFTSFEPLGDLVTSDMKHMIEVEARKQAEKIKQALLDEDAEATAQPAAATVEKDEAPVSDTDAAPVPDDFPPGTDQDSQRNDTP